MAPASGTAPQRSGVHLVCFPKRANGKTASGTACRSGGTAKREIMKRLNTDTGSLTVSEITMSAALTRPIRPIAIPTGTVSGTGRPQRTQRGLLRHVNHPVCGPDSTATDPNVDSGAHRGEATRQIMAGAITSRSLRRPPIPRSKLTPRSRKRSGVWSWTGTRSFRLPTRPSLQRESVPPQRTPRASTNSPWGPAIRTGFPSARPAIAHGPRPFRWRASSTSGSMPS